ncbi:glycosyltransferase family 2 protein [Parvularcula maris]|uniref:Glycosyltransferase n=1 Tax=Parvularcula maris TaxID=2965077 RepID=A0A9X2L6I3_9PROT|nr:glycosyltransferase [Parvularcula maris]
MLEDPLFSVVIPSYRSASMVGEAVRSALAQDARSLEVIVVDDGSPTEDAQAAEAAGEGDPCLRIIVQHNMGVSAARNTGIRTARGRFIAFLDADDVLLPGALSAHLAAFEEHPELALSFGRVRFWDPAFGEKGRQSARCFSLSLPRILGDNQVCTASNMVVRTEDARQINGFDEALRRAEDQDFLARLYLGGYRTRGLDRLTLNYRTVSGGLSSDLDLFAADWRKAVEKARLLAPGDVALAEPEIEARFARYAVRRRLRLGTSGARDLSLLAGHLVKAPGLLLKEPRRCFSTFIGAAAAPLFRHPHLTRVLSR